MGRIKTRDNCNRLYIYIIYRERRQYRGQELQHRVWGVVLWREEELVLACHVVLCRVLACHVVLCRQRELLLGLLVVLYRKELDFLLSQQVIILLQGVSKEAEF